MRLTLTLLLALSAACSQTKLAKRFPAQAQDTATLEQRLVAWEPVREGLEDGDKEDSLQGLFVNSDRVVAYELVQNATQTLDIEIYEMKDPKFRRLLLEALTRKVAVRIVKDSGTVGDGCNELSPITQEDPEDCRAEKAYVAELIERGATYRWFNKKQLCGTEGKHCFQHGKMIIADDQYLLLSSGNFNSSSFCNKEEKLEKCNRDYSYVTKNKEVIATLRNILDLDYAGTRWEFKSVLGNTHLGVTVSPLSGPRLISLINSATESIWIQNQYLEDPAINAALVQKAKDNVKVYVQVSDFCNYGDVKVTKKDKILSIYSGFDEAGIETRVYHSAMKINDKPGYLHSKAVLIDDQIGWIGSINGSEMSSGQNREFGIIFSEPDSVERLKAQIQADYNHPLVRAWKDSIDCQALKKKVPKRQLAPLPRR